MDNTLEEKIRQTICDDAKGHSIKCRKNDCQCGLTERMDRLTPKLLALFNSNLKEQREQTLREVEKLFESETLIETLRNPTFIPVRFLIEELKDKLAKLATNTLEVKEI